jgi:hypothetical protein
MGGRGSGTPKPEEERLTERVGLSLTASDRKRLLALTQPGESISEAARRLLKKLLDDPEETR